MEQLEKLYNLYLDSGLISSKVSLDMFVNTTREQQAGLYDLGKQAGIFNKTTFEEFESAFVKKKVEDEPTVLPSGTGGLDSSEPQDLDTGRQIDTLTIKIGDLERQIEEEASAPLTEEEQKQFPLGKPAEKTPAMLELESLIKQRDDILQSTDITPTVVPDDLARQKEMDIVDVVLEFPDLEYDKLNATQKVKLDEIAGKYNQSPENFLFDVREKKDEITSMTYMQNIANKLAQGDKYLGEMLVSIPGTAYSIANLISSRAIKELGMLGIDIKDNITSEEFEDLIGTGPILEKLIEEQEYRQKKGDIWNQAQGIQGGPVENFSKGNFKDGFKQLGNMLAESAAVSIGIMMAGFSGLGIGQIARVGTLPMAGPELRKQREENPEQTELENVFKATSLAGAELFFSALTSGTLGKVYKDIIFKEGVEQGAKTFRSGLASMYKEALKRYGMGAAAVGEGIDEVSTQITQNLINGKPALEGVPDAFTVGIAGGGLYGSPITINKGLIQPLNEAVQRININQLIKPSEANNIVEVYKNPEIGQLQIDISKLPKAEQILDKDLKKQVKKQEITKEEAQQIKQNFNDTQNINVKLDAAEVTGETKIKAANLLRDKLALEKKVAEINDTTLSTKEQEAITEIDKQLIDITKEVEEKVSEEIVEEETADVVEPGIEEETVEVAEDRVQQLIETINDPSAGIEETVEIGRNKGFSDIEIQKVLQGRGFKIRDIKPVLEEARDLSREVVGIPLPAAFANIPGGINVGKPLFEDIQKQVNEFEVKEEASRGEVREKALEILRASDVYQNLDTIEQQELDVALDKAIGTTANRKIQQEIRGIKQDIKTFKEGVKDLKVAQSKVSKFIRDVLPSSPTVEKFVASINKVTSKQDLPAVAEKIIKDVEVLRDKQKQKVIKEIQTLVSKKARIRKTRSNKSRGGDISAQGKQFFQEVNKVLNTVLKGDASDFESMVRELVYTTKKNKNGEIETINSIERINELTLKEISGQKLNQEESAFLDRMTAIELFNDIQSKSLEEVQDLLNDLKLARSQAIADLNRRKELKALRAKKLQDRATNEIASEYPFLFDENGNLESESRLNQKKIQTRIWNVLNGKGFWKNLKPVIDKMRVYTVPGLTNMLREYMYHIGTIAYELDGNADGKIFSEYFYKRINSADNKAIEGRFKQDDKLNEIAASIDGVKNLQDLKKSFGFEQLEIKTSKGSWLLSKDNLARIYALSLNEQQAAMLEKDGFDAAKIEEIKQILGKDIVEFVDKTVAYLSTENYESVNEVYREINDINLPRIENYFPTRTVREIPTDEFISSLSRGEFSNVFDAETSPLLARTNVKGKVSLNPDETFLNTLANHLETTERYKAFAAEVENLNTLVRTPAVQRLLKDALRQDKLIKQLLNQAINPYAGKQLDKTTTWFMSNYTGVALSLKLIQYVKQATSFINAFENYRYLPKTGKRGRLETIVDHIGFAADMAYTFLTFPVQLYEAYQLSPSFRDRINKGVKGDIVGLEAGGKEGRALRKKQQQLVRIFKQMFASPTVFGDAMGILGYKAVLNRDLKNGMPRQEAIDKFNDYNATQQTRRGGERNTLQNSPESLLRVFTMFMSTTFLQLNKAMQGMGGIMNSLSPYDGDKFSMNNIKRPTAKNLRAVTTNIFLANALFVMAANIFKYLKGSEDDKDEVIKRVLQSPLNILWSIPLVGGAAEEAYYNLTEESRNFRSRDIVNPYTETLRRGLKLYREQEEKVDKKNGITPFLVSILELYMGVQKNPIEGTVKTLTDIVEGGEVNPDDFYDMIGVSPYYRPTEEESDFEFSKSGGGEFQSEAMKKIRKSFNDIKKQYRNKFKTRFK